VLAVVVPASILLDLGVYPDHVTQFLVIRGVCEAVIITMLILQRGEWGRRFTRFFSVAWVVPMTAYVGVMIAFVDGLRSGYYFGVALVMLGGALIMQWGALERYLAAAISLVLYTAGGIVQWLVGDIGTPATYYPAAANNLFMLTTATAAAVVASTITERLRFSQFRLQYELAQQREELASAYDRLRELDRAKSEFFANISHELRTPLTLVLAPVEELRASAELVSAPLARSALDVIYRNALRLLGLIDDLLDLVRLEQGKLEPTISAVRIGPLLSELLSSVKPTAEKEGLEIREDLSAVNGVGVSGDLGLLEKVFLNLLFNAIKYTPRGGAVAVRGNVQGSNVVVDVNDTGPGIPADKVAHVFDRFWQEEEAAPRVRQGAGIGLALVRELLEIQNGSVAVSSVEGQGSTFTVTLPVYASEAELTEPAEGPQGWLDSQGRLAQMHKGLVPAGTASADSPGADGNAKPSLLIVEDEPEMRTFLASQLGRDFVVRAARTGEEALRFAEESLPEMVLTDLMLPGIDGIEFVRRVKAIDSTKPMRVVMLTARADEAAKYAALEAGVDDFLTKPFRTLELRTRLANLRSHNELALQLRDKNLELERTLRELSETQAMLFQAEKMSSLGTLTAGIMHEINNPLNFMMTAVAFLRRELPGPSEDVAETITDLDAGLKRIHRIVTDLRSFTHQSGADTEQAVHGADVVRTAKHLLAHVMEDGVVLTEEIDEGVSIRGNENQLVQLLVNLLQNAIQATEGNDVRGRQRRVTVRVANADGSVMIVVRDNGMGIPRESMSKLFEPFFTTKDPGRGMGLGLSICHTIVTRHGGRIEVTSEPGESAEFIVTLPTA